MMKKKQLLWTNVNTQKKLTESLKNDEISIISTDTILGLLANITQKSFTALNNIKGESRKNPYLTLIWPKSKLYNFVDNSTITPQLYNFLEKCWPGPVTIIFKSIKNLPHFLISKERKIALRCPNHEHLKKLLKSFKGLFSTSANKTTNPTPIHINEIDLEILQKIKYLVIDTSKLLYKTLPSSIIDVSDRNIIKVVREGSYPISKLEEYYGTKFKK